MDGDGVVDAVWPVDAAEIADVSPLPSTLRETSHPPKPTAATRDCGGADQHLPSATVAWVVRGSVRDVPTARWPCPRTVERTIGVAGGALGHDEFRVGVDPNRHPEPLGDHLRDKRDPRGPADEQRGIERRRFDLGPFNGLLHAGDGLGHHRSDHCLELGAGEPNGCRVARQQYRDVSHRVGRERLLGVDATTAKAGEGGDTLG